MKIYCIFLLCCLFVSAAPSTSLGEVTFRPFVTTDGRSLNAAVKDYNERNGKIQIKREDGKLIWILPKVFSEPDREYIRQWIAVDQFMSPTKFRIKGSPKKSRISEHKTEVVYEITLENKTDFPLNGLRIEYRAFVLNKGYDDKENSSRVDGGQLHIAEIPAGKPISEKTKAMTLITQFKHVKETTGTIGVYDIYDKKISSEKLEGFWIKVHGPEIDGKPSVREWCNPPDTRKNFAWKDAITHAPAVRAISSASGPHDYSDKELELLKEANSLQKSAPEKALALYRKAYEIEQSSWAESGIGELYLYHLKPTNIPLGLEWLEKAAVKNDYRAYHILTQFYATKGDSQYRDTKKAIEYGLQLVSINPSYGDYRSLANLYAQDGQFNKAVENQKRAIEKYEKFYKQREDPSPARLSKMEATLELYKNKKAK